VNEEKRYRELVELRVNIATRNGWQVNRDKKSPWEWVLTNKKGFVVSKVSVTKKAKFTLKDFVSWLRHIWICRKTSVTWLTPIWPTNQRLSTNILDVKNWITWSTLRQKLAAKYI
jgi:hypothetical protein